MYFSVVIALFAMFVTSVVANMSGSTTVTYDNVYDDPKGSLHQVACSDGKNGLITKGYKMFGDFKTFPYIGGGFPVEGWNSKDCGSCWQLTYECTGKSVYVLLIDSAEDSFNISQEALDDLTDGHALDLCRIDIDYKKVDSSKCKI